jgi:hypothetical protein
MGGADSESVARCCEPFRSRARAKSTPCTLSAFRRQNNAEDDALIRAHLSRSADVSTAIGRHHVADLVIRNQRPLPVYFNLVVVANHATLGRTAAWPSFLLSFV